MTRAPATDIVRLTDDRLEDYERLVLSDPRALLYASSKYLRLLRELLDAEDHYLLAVDGEGRPVGAIPSFLCHGPWGPVLNSLPFFGSHGGVVGPCPEEVRRRLVAAWRALAADRDCAAATLVEPLDDPDPLLYDRESACDFHDERVGRVTPLPAGQGDAAEALLAGMHPKTRNAVRKALSSGMTASPDDWPGRLDFLAAAHRRGIEALGGSPKPERFFALVEELFSEGEDYAVYTAWNGGTPVAALLLFFYNGTVEYFTPAVPEEHRGLNPMHLLIFRAMTDAVARGLRRWNWGGTWASQEGVRRFKERWGGGDHPYRYHVLLGNPRLLEATPGELAAAYPFFYVLPYGLLGRGT